MDQKDNLTHNKLNIDTLIILFVCVCILFSKEIALGSNRVSKCYFLEDYTLRYQKRRGSYMVSCQRKMECCMRCSINTSFLLLTIDLTLSIASNHLKIYTDKP